MIVWEWMITKTNERLKYFKEECDKNVEKLVEMNKVAKDKNIKIDNKPEDLLNELESLQLFLRYKVKEDA
jgi:hypothetical protein